jgi:tetratricopeptide (TPR) repeat protein
MKNKSGLLITIPIIICFILSIQDFSLAEIIVLKSGRKIEGKILERTDKYIKLDFYGVSLTYWVDEIDHIEDKNYPLDKNIPNSVSLSTNDNSLEGKSPQKLFEQFSPAVVTIDVKMSSGASELGSGFIIEPNGIVVTNYHVISEAKEIKIKLKDQREYQVEYIIGYDTNKDFCIFKINALNLPFIPIGDSSQIGAGERVYVIGNPLGFDYTISDGLISSFRNILETQWIQISAPISKGSSGSPVINFNGKVIGIVTFMMPEGQNLNFALPINQIKPSLYKKDKITFSQFLQQKSEAEKYYFLGLESYLQSNFEEAERNYKKALELDLACWQAYASLGAMYGTKGDFNKALEYLKKASELNQESEGINISLGSIYNKLGDPEQAIRFFNNAVRINPYSALAYCGLGENYYLLGDFNEAISNHRKALSINPNYAEAYKSLGMAFFVSDQHEEGIRNLNKAIELDPDDTDALILLSIVYGSVGNERQANEIMSEAKKLLKKEGRENEIVDIEKSVKDYADKIKKNLKGRNTVLGKDSLKDSLILFDGPQLPFTIKYPKNWYTKEESGAVFLSREPLYKPSDVFIVGVSVFWYKGKLLDLEWDYFKNLQINFFKEKGLEVTNIEEKYIDNHPALTFLASDNTHKMFCIDIKKDYDLISAVLESPGHEWKEYEPIFKEIMSSFKIR